MKDNFLIELPGACKKNGDLRFEIKRSKISKNIRTQKAKILLRKYLQHLVIIL